MKEKAKNKGRRYGGERKLNAKKVFGTILAILVLIIVVLTFAKLMKDENKYAKDEKFEYFTVYTGDRWGVINNKGEIVIEPIYSEMVLIPDKSKPIFICVYDVNETDGTYKTKAINENSDRLFLDYDTIEAIDNYDKKQNIWYENNTLRVSKNGKYGLIDLLGAEILPCEYDEISALKSVESNFIIKKDGKVGLANSKGQMIVNLEYADILTLDNGYNNGYIIKSQEGKFGVISTSQTIIVNPIYDEVKYLNSTNYYAVKSDGKWKLINENSEIFLDGIYDNIIEAKGDNIIVNRNNKYGVVNKDGAEQIPLEYDSLKYAFSIYYIAAKDGKYGIIDTNNTATIELKYTNINYVEKGAFLMADLSDSTTVIYDNNLAEKLTGIVTEINEDSGYIRLHVDSEYKYYNFKLEEKSSKDILKGNTLYLSKKDNKYGYINKNGTVVVDYIYDDATEQNEYGYCAVKQNGVWGSINKIGNIELNPTVNLDNNLYTYFIGKWHLSTSGAYYTN